MVIPLSLAGGFKVGWPQGLLLLGYGVLVIGTVDNIVRPLLVRAGLESIRWPYSAVSPASG